MQAQELCKVLSRPQLPLASTLSPAGSYRVVLLVIGHEDDTKAAVASEATAAHVWCERQASMQLWWFSVHRGLRHPFCMVDLPVQVTRQDAVKAAHSRQHAKHPQA